MREKRKVGSKRRSGIWLTAGVLRHILSSCQVCNFEPMNAKHVQYRYIEDCEGALAAQARSPGFEYQ